jgi:undecaprenyl-diphosphatase
VLGIVQGLTEFLPISSTGHLRIVPAFLGWEDPGAAFTAVTQLGTMTAVLLYFRHDLLKIARAWLRSLYLIGTALIVLGLILLLAERVGTKTRSIEQIEVRDGVAVGFAQALALIPGVSRSGATITAGLFLGLDRPTAARFSFLLSVPAVVLSGVFEMLSIAGDEGAHASTADVIIATFLAFVTGYAAIAWLLRYLSTHSLMIFVIYRVALGTLVLALVSAGAIK